VLLVQDEGCVRNAQPFSPSTHFSVINSSIILEARNKFAKSECTVSSVVDIKERSATWRRFNYATSHDIV